MKYGQLGKTGIEVSRLCVGCLSFGQPFSDSHMWTLNPEETETIVRKTLDLGFTFFDTANTYSHGTSEEYLGRAIKNSVSRDKVILATKVYFNEGHLSKKAIQREIDGSLKRLNTDYVDLYIIHRFDRTTPIEETMEAMDGLVKCGKVRALGASAMYGYQFYSMQVAAERNGWTKFCSMQNHYNLLYREDEREIIPLCKQEGVALTPFSPLAAGRLARVEWKSDSPRSQMDRTASQKYDGTQETDYEIVRRVHETAEKHGATMTQVAIAWHMAKGMTAPIIGATKAKYLEDAAGALELSLSAEDIAYLEEPYQPHKVVGLKTDDDPK